MGYDPNSFSEKSNEKINDEFPPIIPTTHVWTTKDNLENLKEIPLEVYQFERKWGVKGMLIDTMQGNEDWYEVQHQDSTLGRYHVTELKLQHDYDNDDNDGDDNEPPVGPDDVLLLELSEKTLLEPALSFQA